MQATFESYARYYLESFRLPGRSVDEIARGHDVVGYEHVEAARAKGRGVILALPHLGGWEWSAFWLTLVKRVPVTAVVEPLQPSRAVRVVRVVPAFARHDDRGAGTGRGPPGARRAAPQRGRLPARRPRPGRHRRRGLVLRRDARRCPAVPPRWRCARAPTCCRPPSTSGPAGRASAAWSARRSTPPGRGRLREDVARVTQDLARDFEVLIRAAPEQWHLMQPNWPSDRAALARRRAAGPSRWW